MRASIRLANITMAIKSRPLAHTHTNTQVVEVDSSPESQDAVLAHRLWAVSEELAAPFLGPLEEKDGGKE